MKNLSKKLGVVVLAGSLMVTPLSATTFGGNTSDWATNTVQEYLGAQFDMSKNYKTITTREEFAELCALSLTKLGYDLPMPGYSQFTDTSNPSVMKLANAGILKGNSATSFGPYGHISREEMASVILRMYQKLGVALPTANATFNVSDQYAIAPWALKSVREVYEAGLVLGDGNLYNPKTTVTREQAIVIVSRSEVQLGAYDKGSTGDLGQGGGGQAVDKGAYTYDASTQTMVIKDSITLESSDTKLPKAITKLVVGKDINVKLIDMEVMEVNAGAGSTVKLTRTPLLTLSADGATITADSESKITTATVSGNSEIEAKEVTTMNVKDGTDKHTVKVTSDVTTLNIDTPSKVKFVGDTENIVISGKSIVDLVTKADKLKISGDSDVVLGDKSRIKDVEISDQIKFVIEENAEVYKINVERDGRGSEIETVSLYETDFKIDGNVMINGYAAKRGAKVAYNAGKLDIDGIITEDILDDKDDPTDDVFTKLGKDLNRVVIPVELVGVVALPTVSQNGYEINYTVNPSTAATIQQSGINTVLAPNVVAVNTQVEVTVSVRTKGIIREKSIFTIVRAGGGGGVIVSPTQNDLNLTDMPSAINAVVSLPRSTKNSLQAITYTTTTPEVAMITGNVLNPVNSGIARITARTADGASRDFVVNVEIVENSFKTEMTGLLNGINLPPVITKMVDFRVEQTSKVDSTVKYYVSAEIVTGEDAVHLGTSAGGGYLTVAPMGISTDENVTVKFTVRAGNGEPEQTKVVSTSVKASDIKVTSTSRFLSTGNRVNLSYTIDRDPGEITVEINDYDGDKDLLGTFRHIPVIKDGKVSFSEIVDLSAAPTDGKCTLTMRDNASNVIHTSIIQ